MSATDAIVWVDPARCSGEPCIYGTRIPLYCLVDRVAAGESAESVADDYHLERRHVLGACWYEAVHGRGRKLRKAWGAWADEWHGAMWRDEWRGVPDPPEVKS